MGTTSSCCDAETMRPVLKPRHLRSRLEKVDTSDGAFEGEPREDSHPLRPPVAIILCDEGTSETAALESSLRPVGICTPRNDAQGAGSAGGGGFHNVLSTISMNNTGGNSNICPDSPHPIPLARRASSVTFSHPPELSDCSTSLRQARSRPLPASRHSGHRFAKWSTSTSVGAASNYSDSNDESSLERSDCQTNPAPTTREFVDFDSSQLTHNRSPLLESDTTSPSNFYRWLTPVVD